VANELFVGNNWGRCVAARRSRHPNPRPIATACVSKISQYSVHRLSIIKLKTLRVIPTTRSARRYPTSSSGPVTYGMIYARQNCKDPIHAIFDEDSFGRTSSW
jgi:hypothetical protein